jgi:hypothetical protein
MHGGHVKTGEERFNPRRTIFREGLIASLVIAVPVLVVLYLLTIPSGAWHDVLIAQIVATAVSVVSIVGYFGVAIWVDDDSVRERGFLTRVRTVPRASIASAILINTFSGTGTDTTAQLFVLNRDGARVLRMRGQFWSGESMHDVLDRLKVPVTEVTEAASLAELRVDYPALLYWFERYPTFAGIIFAGSAGIVGVLVVVLLHVLNVPVLSATAA